MNAIPIPEYSFDFTFTPDEPVMSQLLDKMEEIRTQIRTRRDNKNLLQTLTYSVNCQKVGTRAIQGHTQLRQSPTDQLAVIYQHQHPITFFQSATVVLSISVSSIYPKSMGWARYNGNSQQCYNVWINNAPYTLVGIVYPPNPSYNPSLTDMLGILISEQIRFNTLSVYHDAFKDQGVLDSTVGELYYNLFNSFKTSVYNCWGEVWQEEELQISAKYKNIERTVIVKKEVPLP